MPEFKSFEEVELRTGIDPSFFAETLTTDIELTDALFDLIDNSIDSARNAIIQSEYEKDSRGLPKDYSGYEITLRFTRDSIAIHDNCIGFETDTLEQDTFFTGKRSSHKHGIGYYGLGLKRALLKAGSRYGLVTDNGESLYKSSFNARSFSSFSSTTSDDLEKLMARKYPSRGRKHTLFVVYGLHRNVKFQISNIEWFNNSVSELSVRYSMFLRKGLRIKIVNSQLPELVTLDVQPTIPEVRTDGLINVITDSFDMPGVVCDFEVGIHRDYRFPGEWDSNSKDNELLTRSYGVYYICNDRVIVAASTEDRHGFTTQWHSEYGGFICLAHIVGENPRDLPWNTAKTEIKVNSPLFLEIRKKVEPLALKYRSASKVLINLWTKKIPKDLPLLERKKAFAEQTTGKKLNDSNVAAIVKKKSISADSSDNKIKTNLTATKNDAEQKPSLVTPKGSDKSVSNSNRRHTKDWNELIPREQFPVSDDDAVLNNLVIEASNLLIDKFPHASCLIYRSIFECAFRHFVKTNKLFQKVIEHYYTKGDGKHKNHTQEYKKQQGIDLSMCSKWIADSPNYFPQERRKRLGVCAGKLLQHIPLMNGIVHGVQFLGQEGKVHSIRNETIELLEFLVLAKINED